MNERVKEALFKTFEIRENARIAQINRGNSDQGERAGATAGKHLDPIADIIANELINAGIDADNLYSGSSNMEIPGWFRPNKQWDILAFERSQLVAAIELKSINSSFGNNFNNRTEEALGSATDANIATKYQMYGEATPPAFGYVMIVKSTDLSRKVIERINEPHFKVDPIFYNNSYIDRFAIMCSRLLAEKLYDAVWYVVVDPENKSILEPKESLTYDKFIKRMKMQVSLFM